MQRPARVVRHQDFHLPFGQVLDGLVLRPRFTVLALGGTSGFLVLTPPEEPAFFLDAAPCHDLFGRRLDEILGGLFVPRPESDGRVRRRRDLLLEAAADLHQLGKALHREQERRVRAARGLKNLREVAVPKWRELVQHNREDRAILPPPVCLVLVTLTHGELDILQQHLPERPNGLGVLVRVQAHEQNQLLIDDVFDRQQVVILSGDGRQFIVEERHALVDETLDLGYALAVLERLHQVLDAHFEVEPLLGRDAASRSRRCMAFSICSFSTSWSSSITITS